MKAASAFRVQEFWGIDQCGASKTRGRSAKELSAARVLVNGRKARLDFFQLSNVGELWTHCQTRNPWIGIDSVFGVPVACQAHFGNPREEFKRAAQFEFHGKKYGMTVAAAFFSRAIWPRPLPRRQCEIITHSNSVLTNRPAQKNIQTGTFRIWSDLGQLDPRSFVLWPFETSTRKSFHVPVVMEVYPTLFWKKIFGQSVRQWNQLGTILKVVSHLHLTEDPRTPDQADAAVVAVTLMVLNQRHKGLQVYESEAPPCEGWIYGA